MFVLTKTDFELKDFSPHNMIKLLNLLKWEYYTHKRMSNSFIVNPSGTWQFKGEVCKRIHFLCVMCLLYNTFIE